MNQRTKTAIVQHANKNGYEAKIYQTFLYVDVMLSNPSKPNTYAHLFLFNDNNVLNKFKKQFKETIQSDNIINNFHLLL